MADPPPAFPGSDRQHRRKEFLMPAGSKSDPWQLTTPPGTSAYSMYRDADADPPALVCQVGSTTLKYRLSAIDDLHAWLKSQGDWVLLGAADESKPPRTGRSRHGAGLPPTRWAAGTACARDTAAGS